LGGMALGAALSRWARKPVTWIVVAAAVLGAAFGTMKVIERRDRIRWAREEAVPEIRRLHQDQMQSSLAAYRLAERARPYLPGDPEFQTLLSDLVVETTIATDPPGATVYSKPYEEPDAPWEMIGTTPIERLVAPIIYMRFKVEKPGFETLIDVRMPGDWDWETARWVPDTIEWKLHESGGSPAGMVLVLGDDDVPDFWVDRYEVTNRQFKEFVDLGGYSTADYWKFEFVKDGTILSRDEALALFLDSTGRPGPSTWEAGSSPTGEDDFPVTGISWYEAAAYAEFMGKSLPTLRHWKLATGAHVDMSQFIFTRFLIPLSNFANNGPIKVGSTLAMTPFGAVDMAGNVREWCWNEAEAGRCLRGGAWNDEVYMFGNVTQAPTFDRSEKNGFRCVKYIDRESIPAETFEPHSDHAQRDLYAEQPVSDEVFRVYADLYEYDDTELESKVEDRAEGDDWVREKISFNAAYGDDRVLGQLFLPTAVRPPYQAVVYFAGDGARAAGPLSDLESRWEFKNNLSFLITTGRAVFYTAYQGTHERRDGAPAGPWDSWDSESHEFAEYRTQQVKDIRRSVDYLESRDDIDADKIAFYGFSRGAVEASLLLAVDDRFKAAISLVGGLVSWRRRPEIDPLNFAPRVTTPILMLNGRYDLAILYGPEAKPMFDLLGTPPEHKLHRVYDSDHIIERKELIKESLAWLDRYLGSVQLESQ
jgi:predicted esterase